MEARLPGADARLRGRARRRCAVNVRSLTLRTPQPSDAPFLFDLYTTTRDVVATAGWDETDRLALSPPGAPRARETFPGAVSRRGRARDLRRRRTRRSARREPNPRRRSRRRHRHPPRVRPRARRDATAAASSSTKHARTRFRFTCGSGRRTPHCVFHDGWGFRWCPSRAVTRSSNCLPNLARGQGARSRPDVPHRRTGPGLVGARSRGLCNQQRCAARVEGSAVSAGACGPVLARG